MQKTDEKAEKVGGSLSKGIGTAAKFGLGLAAAGVAGAGALIGIALNASEAAASIDDVAQRTGLSAKTLQEFKHAAEMSGTSMEVVEKSAVKLTSTMGKYATGNKETVEAFKQLGVSATDSKGKLKSTDEVFPELIQKLAGMTNETERNALSMKLLGKGAVELGPLLNEGAAGVTALKDEAHAMGLVMGDEQVKAGAKFDDTLTVVKAAMGAMVAKIGNEVLPIVQKMLEWIMAHMPQIQAIAGKAFDIISTAVTALGKFVSDVLLPAFTKFWNWVEPYIPKLKQVITEAFNNIKNAIKLAYDYIKPSFDNLVKVIKDSVMPIIMGMWDTVKKAMPGIKGIFEIVMPLIVVAVKLVIDIIAVIIKTVKSIYDFIKPSLDSVANIFSTVFGGIKKAIEGVQKVLDFFNGTKLKDKNATVTTNYKDTGNPSSFSNIGKNANGTDNWRGGLSWVGERGPEIVNLPKGSQVFDNNKSMQMTNSNSGNSKTPVTVQLVLQNGKAIAEFLLDDLDSLMGNKNKINGRGVGIA